MTRPLVTFLLGTALAQAVAANPLDHPAVGRYVAGWQERDGAKVASAFHAAGRYRDPSLPAAIEVPGIAAHVARHREARFELQGARQVGADQVELRWKALWPARQLGFDYVDALKLTGAAIESVESVGTPPPEAARLVAAYELMHDEPTPARLQALLTQDVEVYGSSLPVAGLRYDSYIGFLQGLRGTVFRQQPDAPLALTKDGNIVLRWALEGGGVRLATGVDYITVENERIRKIVGVY